MKPTPEDVAASAGASAPLDAPDAVVESDPGPDESWESVESLPPLPDPGRTPDAYVADLIDQLAYRLLFMEAAFTRLSRQLDSQGLMPPRWEEKLIADAEGDVDTLAKRHTTEGRSDLIAAYLSSTRIG